MHILSVSNWKYAETETPQIFFRLYVGNGKYFEELFAHILNGIVVSGWYVPSAQVAQHAGLTAWLQRIQKKENMKQRKPKIVTNFFQKRT